jgi:signal peptidase
MAGKFLTRLARWFALTLLTVVLLLSLWQAAARYLLGQELPSVFGYSQVIVRSGSMEPAFSAGDLLVLHREEQYWEGDIIGFWENGSLTTHRLIQKTEEGAITKGDFNSTPDPQPVKENQFAGRVVLILPGLGTVFLYLRTPPGVLLIILLGSLLLFFPRRAERSNHRGKRGVK